MGASKHDAFISYTPSNLQQVALPLGLACFQKCSEKEMKQCLEDIVGLGIHIIRGFLLRKGLFICTG